MSALNFIILASIAMVGCMADPKQKQSVFNMTETMNSINGSVNIELGGILHKERTKELQFIVVITMLILLMLIIIAAIVISHEQTKRRKVAANRQRENGTELVPLKKAIHLQVIGGDADDKTLRQWQNKTVFVTGIPQVRHPAFDVELGVQWTDPEQAIVSLERHVNVHQWSEESTLVNKRVNEKGRDRLQRVRINEYSQVWSEDFIDSGSFENSAYRNKNVSPSLHPLTFDCDRFFIDNIEVDISYAKKVLWQKQVLQISQTEFNFPEDHLGQWRRRVDDYTVERKWSSDQDTNTIGDLRVTYRAATIDTTKAITMAGVLRGNKLCLSTATHKMFKEAKEPGELITVMV